MNTSGPEYQKLLNRFIQIHNTAQPGIDGKVASGAELAARRLMGRVAIAGYTGRVTQEEASFLARAIENIRVR